MHKIEVVFLIKADTWQQPLPRMESKGPFTVEASGYEKVEGETIPRRHPVAKVKTRNS